jgi:hypothetical protein
MYAGLGGELKWQEESIEVASGEQSFKSRLKLWQKNEQSEVLHSKSQFLISGSAKGSEPRKSENDWGRKRKSKSFA